MLVDHALAHQGHRDADGGGGRALAGARLQEVELPFLDGELEVLHVLVVPLEAIGDRQQLVVDRRHPPLEVVDVLGRPDAGHDVLALGVREELGVEATLARPRVAREADPRPRRRAQIAEHHRHHRDGGPPVRGDAVDPAVLGRLLGEPRVEDGGDRQAQLLSRILGKRRTGAGAHDVLERLGQLAELVGGDLGVGPDAEARLHGVELGVEGLAADAEHHAREHRDEAAVAVPGEALVLRPRGEPAHRLVGEAEVEDRLHHARHGGARARTNGDEERTLHVPELQSAGGLELAEVLLHLLPEPFGRRAARLVVVRPGLRGNREAGRHRNAEVGHLRELASLSAQQVTHEGGALGLARPEKVDVLGHRPKKSFKTTGWNALTSIFLTPSPLQRQRETKTATGRFTRGPRVSIATGPSPARGIRCRVTARMLRAGPAAPGEESLATPPAK